MRVAEPHKDAAAFGRLCVETTLAEKWLSILVAAAFGRLCVETTIRHGTCFGFMQPPSGGCVLKPWVSHLNILGMAAAAFGRLCVETVLNVN